MENLKIGDRCMLYYCNMKDFLPHTCSKCNGVYCHPHLSNHECSLLGADDKLAFKCPICNTKIAYTGSQSADEVFNEHSLSGQCGSPAPSQNPDKGIQRTREGGYVIGGSERDKEKKRKCPVCMVKLTEINSFTCRACRVDVCIKHRLSNDHSCVR